MIYSVYACAWLKRCVAFFMMVAVAGFAVAAQDTEEQNAAFRRAVMAVVHSTTANSSATIDPAFDQQWVNGGTSIVRHWTLKITLYSRGNIVGESQTQSVSLSKGLKQATKMALQQAKLSKKALSQTHFKVTFYYPPDGRQYSFVDDHEIIGNNIVPVRILTPALIDNRVQMEKNYLLRMTDPELYGIFQKYDAEHDQRDKKLRTIYTASTLFTLLKVNALRPDTAIEARIVPMGDFLLMMQEKEGDNAGAFHYSYDPETQQKDYRFVVGTASKTIFTLLMLYDKTHDEKYMNAAQAAGNWLLKSVEYDGRVNPVMERDPDDATQWHQDTKQSFLYSGQVLSALSRLYLATGNDNYYQAATRIAERFSVHTMQHGYFVGDDFRTPNSISTSWMVLSLLDYAQIDKKPQSTRYREIISRCADTLVDRQIMNAQDAFNDGRVSDISTSSGNGWINEVMTVLYPFCQKNNQPTCENYRRFIIHASRWLAQNMYNPDNSFGIKNPVAAEGGVITNFIAPTTVRTDAVCHGVNSLVGLLEILPPQESPETPLLQLPERPFDETLGLLKMGY